MKCCDRFRNYGFWVSLAALILLVLKLFGVPVLETSYNDIVNAILSILAILGVLNNPTTANRWYGDDK